MFSHLELFISQKFKLLKFFYQFKKKDFIFCIVILLYSYIYAIRNIVY